MKYIYPLLTLTLIFMMTSCGGLKKTFGSSEYNKSYDEVLTAYVTQENDNDIRFVGQAYNYSFGNAREVKALFENQILLDLNPSNLNLDIAVKEYQSSDITLSVYAHFEVSHLNAEQVEWLEAEGYALELRVNVDANKNEPKPESTPTYIKIIHYQGQRLAQQNNSNAEALVPVIYLEVSEHISR